EATFGNDILQIGAEYTLVDGRKFVINRSDFFLTDVRLIADDGSETELFEVIQVDFTDAPGGKKYEVEGVKTINFESIRFNLGLNESLNKTSPVDYEASSPLNNSGYYWEGWSSYIFSKTEGKVENADGDIVDPWIYHTGTDPLMKEVTLPVDRIFSHDEDNELRIAFDHQGLFQKDGEAIDLGINHDPSTTLNEFITRMSESFTVK
ncbi:hypothetical protein N9B82_05995, partial [Saprospiraceae bacterium]|nr:hypothetical protein [Saprospiraceae bacterium]